MTTASKKLHDAILANSDQLVESYLENGADPNLSPMPAFLDVDDDRDVPHYLKLARSCRSSQTAAISPLHVAVINCYHNHGKYSDDYKARTKSLGIVRSLVNRGASTVKETRNIYVCNTDNYKWISPGSVTPVGLAIFLKQQTTSDDYYSVQRADILDMAIDILQSALKFGKTPKTVPVLESALSTWKCLLFSEKFSDVHFVCDDGTIFPAHKCILAAASSYFSTYFEGPWFDADKHADGRWETSNPPRLMGAVLSFIYTGTVDDDLLGLEAPAVLSVATEYGLSDLAALSEASCTRHLKLDNVKSTLQLAHLHGTKKLKESCFRFVRQKAAQILTDPSMMALATEDPELWKELATAIAPGRGGNKKKPAKRSKK